MSPSASRSSLFRSIDQFSKRRILVLGDLMLDRFVWGTVHRISPEAPVPVVQVTRESEMPGGAGNVVSNLKALGAEVHVAGVVGDDDGADSLLALLDGPRVDLEGVIRHSKIPTILKTRVIAHHQQVVRFDQESRESLPKLLLDALLLHVERELPRMDAVILSDYGKNVIDPYLLQRVIPMIRRSKCPVLVDPKTEHFLRYQKVTCLTPNTQEAVQGMRSVSPRSEEEFIALGKSILGKLKSESLLITRGEKGMTLFESGRVTTIPARAREVFDVTGAGDTVISVFALALGSGASFRHAAEIANYAAGVVVGKIGTATLTVDELKRAIRSV